MAIILKNLCVDCYRGITQLALEDFNHVNILVGDTPRAEAVSSLGKKRQCKVRARGS